MKTKIRMAIVFIGWTSVFLFQVAVFSMQTWAAEFCVGTSIELNNALLTAQANGENDIIRIAQGTYQGSFFYITPETNSLIIEGGYEMGCTSRTTNPANTVLDGDSAGRVIVIVTDKSTHARIDGITVQNGGLSGADGGGVYFMASEGNLEITRCVFSGNSASNGGGVYAGGGTVTLTNNAFTGNSASYSGGGVYADGTTVTLTNNTFTGNSASFYGGGVYADDSNGTVTLTNNAFTGNSASTCGGGVYADAYSGNVTLSNNTFTGNSASSSIGQGGGVWAYTSYSKGTITFTNNTFYANQAVEEGGAIWVLLGNADSIARIYNNILWLNTAPNGADLWIDNDLDTDSLPSPVELFNNDFDQSAAGTWIKIPFSIDPSNLDKADPLFRDAANGDLHLSAGSPCINAGDNNAPELPENDKDGQPRIMNGVVDMGAYESQEILYVEPEGLCGGKLPCYTSIHEAISTSGSRAIINIAGGTYNEDLIFDQDKHLTLRGGWTSDFLKRDSFTTVNSITIRGGTIVPDKIVLK